MIYPWISSSIIVIIYTVYIIYTLLEWNIRWYTRKMLFIYIVVYQWSGHIIHYIMIMENMYDIPQWLILYIYMDYDIWMNMLVYKSILLIVRTYSHI
jgi:hypothetical protein